MRTSDGSNGVHIVAGGYGTRLREFMDDKGYEQSYPKHLLPTGKPNGETILGRIVRQAMSAPTDAPPIIHANEQNAPSIEGHPDIDPSAEVKVGNYPNCLLPILANLTQTRKRTFGCAGDFYADFSWDDMVTSHDAQPYPITFMVGRTVEVDRGLTFDVSENGKIERMKRVERSNSDDLINIGVYMFDPRETVMDALEALATKRQLDKASSIANHLIGEGLVGAYILPSTPYNVNTGETYAALLEHTNKTSTVPICSLLTLSGE